MLSRPATWMSMPVETSDCGSRSTTRVRTPRANAADTSPRVTVVFPTPPFRELTLSTCTADTLPLLLGRYLNVRCAESSLKGLHVHEDPGCQPRRDRHSSVPSR